MKWDVSINQQVSIEYVRLIKQFWIEKGIEGAALDQVLEVEVDKVKSARATVHEQRLAQLISFCLDKVRDEGLQYELGNYLAGQAFIFNDLFNYSKNINQALTDLTQYPLVLTDDSRFKVTFTKQGIVICCTRSYLSDVDVCQTQIYFSHMGTLLEIIYGFEFEFLDMTVPLGHLGQFCYEKSQTDPSYLKKNVMVEGKYPQLFIPSENLYETNISWNKRRYNQIISSIKKQFQKRKRNLDMYFQLKALLRQSINEERTNQEKIAEELQLNVRNMQRQLKQLGTSYQETLDSARKEVVIERLTEDLKKPFTDIAYEVGFNDVSAFYKAFRRWTGMSPGEYRQGLMLEQADVKINLVEPTSNAG